MEASVSSKQALALAFDGVVDLKEVEQADISEHDNHLRRARAHQIVGSDV
jgi:hypothetical protein